MISIINSNRKELIDKLYGKLYNLISILNNLVYNSLKSLIYLACLDMLLQNM